MKVEQVIFIHKNVPGVLRKGNNHITILPGNFGHANIVSERNFE